MGMILLTFMLPIVCQKARTAAQVAMFGMKANDLNIPSG